MKLSEMPRPRKPTLFDGRPKQAIGASSDEWQRRRLRTSRGTCFREAAEKELADELIAERLDLPRRAQQTRRPVHGSGPIAMRRQSNDVAKRKLLAMASRLCRLFGALKRQLITTSIFVRRNTPNGG